MSIRLRSLVGSTNDRCNYCGFLMEPAARFCGGCGRPRSRSSDTVPHTLSFLQSNIPADLADRILRSGGAMLGERKHVTVIFADVRDSTALIDQLDPEEALQILGPVLKSLMDAVHHHDGFVNQTLGDGIMALFGAPIAREDHAVQACSAAIAMRTAVSELNQRTGRDIAIRIGMNSGEVVIHSIGNNLAMNYDAVGKSVHLAARMEELAAPGKILLTAATHDLAKGFVTVEPQGFSNVKGVSEAIEVFELTAMRIRTRWQVRSARGLSVLVGRQNELNSLRTALENAAEGNGQSLTIVAAAGLGKSRLIHDFIRNLSDEWTVLETACPSQRTDSSYYPISTLIRAMFEIGVNENPEAVTDRVKDGVNRLDPMLAPFLPSILSLLDLSADDQEWRKLEPSERRLRTIEAVRSLVLRLARSKPLVILIEDLHWSDAETRLILQNLADALDKTQIVIIMTQRPEGAPPALGTMRLDLSPLDDATSHQLIDWLMGDDGSLVPIKRRILAQAQGNPLFMEELVQALKETRILDGNPGNYRVANKTGRVEIPHTIHSVLAARIDLLDGFPKSLLQTSAVIGMEISVALLSGMMDVTPAEISGELRTLEIADFLRKIRSATSADYSFKHELTREVVYSTMLLGLRRSLHAKAVEVIESRFSDRLDEHIDRLADHAFQAELWEKAVPYQLRSCRRAIKRGANQDAISICERGLETLSHLPASAARIKAEIDFRLALVIALEPLGRHRQIAAVLREASRSSDSFGDPQRTAAVNCQLAVALWRLGEHPAAMAAAEVARNIANEIRDSSLQFASLLIVGIIHHETGAFAESVDIHERCIALETPELDQKRAGWAAYPSVLLRTFMADSLIELGELDRAEAMAEDASRRAEILDHAYSRTNINHVLGRLRIAQARYAEALSLLRESWQTCLDLEIIQMYPVFAARMGEAHLATGDVETALDILSVPERLDVPLAEHSFGWRYLFLAQGQALLTAGRLTEARAAGERALALAEQRGEPPQQAYAMHLLGKIARKENPQDFAITEAYFKRALQLAEKCGMKTLTTMCRQALGNLVNQHGEASIAHR
jgi:class 3 adenylate cyclase/tetratricopeptide (TPR) repeat protein